MNKKVTLKDVARRAGVSYQTVSKILRNQMQVTPEVRARVQAAVGELGYRPNVAGRNLRLQSSHLIGYRGTRSPNFSPILEEFEQSIVDAAERFGYHILLFPQRAGTDLSETYEELVYTGRVDGFVLSDLGYGDPRIPVLQALNVPLVAFGRTEGDSSTFPYVDVDGRAGIRQVVDHLMEHGHRRIAALGWPEDSRVGADRLAGYGDAMAAAGCEVDPAWVKHSAGEFDYGYTAATNCWTCPPPPPNRHRNGI
jgi:DNA-binding LacI/PurR family transcriptional regulator